MNKKRGDKLLREIEYWKAEAERLTAGSVAVPIIGEDLGGIQFLCSACNFPKNDTLTMDMSFCWNCGIKLDWSEWEHVK